MSKKKMPINGNTFSFFFGFLASLVSSLQFSMELWDKTETKCNSILKS